MVGAFLWLLIGGGEGVLPYVSASGSLGGCMSTTPKINGEATGLPFAIDLDRLFAGFPDLNQRLELPAFARPSDIALKILCDEIDACKVATGDGCHVLATCAPVDFIAAQIVPLDGGLIAFRGERGGQRACVVQHFTQINMLLLVVPIKPGESRKITGFGR